MLRQSGKSSVAKRVHALAGAALGRCDSVRHEHARLGLEVRDTTGRAR